VAWLRPERKKKGREGTQPGFSKLNEEVLLYTLHRKFDLIFPKMNRVTDPGKI
jgi:hypothetical protein